MPTVETTIEIAKPLQVVAEAFMDPDNWTHWMKDLERYEIITREPGEVGSVAHLHYVQEGQTYVMEDVLEEMVTDTYFRSRVTGQGMIVKVETWLRETESGTAVTMRWSGKGSSLRMRCILPFLRGAIARGARSELETFKNLVESRGAHFAD